MTEPKSPGEPRLAISPFRDWIIQRSAAFARRKCLGDGVPVREASSTEVSYTGLCILAEECRISERTLRRYVEGFERRKTGSIRDITDVPLQTVDKCLSNEGTTLLWELYPELGH
jgi:hypothetical protein